MNGRRVRWVVWAVNASAGLTLLGNPDVAPWLIAAGLALGLVPCVHAWRAADGTALRPAIAWAFLAIVLGIAAEVAAASESIGGGRPLTGRLTYLCCLTELAALSTVLNARSPGGGAWALLMVLLVVVFQIPWMEGLGANGAWGRLATVRLDDPWTLFYGLLVVVGVTNYFFTRYSASAAWLGVGFLFEYLALTRTISRPLPLATVWTAFPLALSLAAACAWAPRGLTPESRLESLWFWFREGWGVVWGLRVLDRFTRARRTARLAVPAHLARGRRRRGLPPWRGDAS